MMGWLNKTMDALGVPLEEATASEVTGVIAPSGWMPGQHMPGAVVAGKPPGADSLATRLGLIRYAPRAIKLDKAWTAGVPDRWPAVGEYLRQRTGHAFPVLSRLRNRRAIRAIATMIKENLGESAGQSHLNWSRSELLLFIMSHLVAKWVRETPPISHSVECLCSIPLANIRQVGRHGAPGPDFSPQVEAWW